MPFFNERSIEPHDDDSELVGKRETFGFDDLPTSYYQDLRQESEQHDTDALITPTAKQTTFNMQVGSSAIAVSFPAPSEHLSEAEREEADEVARQIALSLGLTPQQNSLRHFLAKLETIIGLTATFFIGFAPSVIMAVGTLVLLVHGEWNWGFLSIAGACVSGWLAGRVAGHAGRSLTVCYPELMIGRPVPLKADPLPSSLGFAVHLAMSLPRMNRWMRPLLSVYWICHFAVGVVLAVAMHGWLNQGIRNPSLLTIALPLAFHVAFMIAANIYLTVGVAAITRNEDVVSAVWRLRFSIDLVLTLLVAVISLGM